MRLPKRPDNFRAPVGEIVHSRMSGLTPTFVLEKTRKFAGSYSTAIMKGLKYEAKVHEYMLKNFSRFYIKSPWFYFVDDEGGHWCQPDGLYINQKCGFIIIVEIKHAHTSNAWWQLVGLYKPVVKSLFGDGFDYRLLEVVRWFEPSVNFPNIKLTSDPSYAPKAPNVGVHILPESVLSGR